MLRVVRAPAAVVLLLAMIAAGCGDGGTGGGVGGDGGTGDGRVGDGGVARPRGRM